MTRNEDMYPCAALRRVRSLLRVHAAKSCHMLSCMLTALRRVSR
jgi:hypothetical protein